ncbi:MAG: EscU/YscU/HrcU family type III secretion system export apparatus switch protein [Erysipelotrichaceae bacterium]
MRKKKKKAVALKYNPNADVAPIVIASGYGAVAENIIHIGEQEGIPIYRDDHAASILCMLELGNQIPVELYELIASLYCEVVKQAKDLIESDE